MVILKSSMFLLFIRWLIFLLKDCQRTGFLFLCNKLGLKLSPMYHSHVAPDSLQPTDYLQPSSLSSAMESDLRGNVE